MRRTKCLFTIAGIVIGLLTPVQMARADTLPPLSVLTAEWWQWALSIPTSVNPQLDETGDNCMVGQRGSIWFLAGSFTGGSATRTCSVPEGATLFFPVINQVNFNTPNVCGQDSQNLTVKDMRAASKVFVDGAHDLLVRVDGMKVNNLLQRVQSQVFEIALPEENVFDAPCVGAGNVPSGIYSPAVDDGYYVTLQPLTTGKRHKVEFHAESGSTFSQNITYTLIVVPVSLQ